MPKVSLGVQQRFSFQIAPTCSDQDIESCARSQREFLTLGEILKETQARPRDADDHGGRPVVRLLGGYVRTIMSRLLPLELATASMTPSLPGSLTLLRVTVSGA